MRAFFVVVVAVLTLWPSLVAAQAVKIGAVVPLTGRYGPGGAQVRAEEAAVQTARLNLEWTRVRSPIAGRVSVRPWRPSAANANGYHLRARQHRPSVASPPTPEQAAVIGADVLDEEQPAARPQDPRSLGEDGCRDRELLHVVEAGLVDHAQRRGHVPRVVAVQRPDELAGTMYVVVERGGIAP